MAKHLMLERRFAPFFWTQFLGAFNDNVFKNGLVILIAFKIARQSDAGFMINLAGGVFILPFLVFSIIAGQISDRFSKSRIILWTKAFEMVIMLLGLIGFYGNNIYFLLAVLFLMGTQSAFFGPAKYSYIPEVFAKNDIMKATAWVEMGTFSAILLGTIVGGFLMSQGGLAIGTGVVLFAVLGVVTAKKIPAMPAMAPETKLSLNPMNQLKNMAIASRKKTSHMSSIFLISMFWFYGAALLAQFPTYVKFVLNGSEMLVTFFLGLFTLSLAIGSMVSGVVSRGRIEVGLVPIGALGMSLFVFDLSLIDYSSFTQSQLGLQEFFLNSNPWTICRILGDQLGIGISGSFFIVPLYAVLQARSDKKECSVIIAANNVVNSIFMVLSSALTMLLYSYNFQTLEIFQFIAWFVLLINAAALIYHREYLLRTLHFFIPPRNGLAVFAREGMQHEERSNLICTTELSLLLKVRLLVAAQDQITFLKQQDFASMDKFLSRVEVLMRNGNQICLVTPFPLKKLSWKKQLLELCANQNCRVSELHSQNNRTYHYTSPAVVY